MIIQQVKCNNYNLYITGRGVNNEVSSPSRIIKVITTLSRMVLNM